MNKLMPLIVAVSVFAFSLGGGAADISDDAVRQIMIEQSHRSYDGECPCPYSVKKGGICSGSSGWELSGGDWPLCYLSDISDEMVAEFRQQNSL